MTTIDHDAAAEGDETHTVKEPGLWRDNGWTARVIKNMDDDGWAVEMILDGESEPALVGPWTMGRDKKNPAARCQRLQYPGQDRLRGVAQA